MVLLPTIAHYRLTQVLYEGSRTLVYRAIRDADQQPVVLKLLRREAPSASDSLRLRNHYTLTRTHPLPGVVRSLALEPWGQSVVLVMADDGCLSLDRYLHHQSLTLASFLHIAIQLADILMGLHHQRIIHKDIKPSNILIQPDTHRIWLTDFGLASKFPQAALDLQSPGVLEGTLAYLSPEQTGRMNRGIDYRSDFYSLGVTFYELLTGQLPFQSTDAMELVYCHLAKEPVPPHQVVRERRSGLQSPSFGQCSIPPILSQIVLKLMAKNADDRYQSALGLKADLETCREQYQTSGQIADFSLGQVDDLAQFNLPQKLYGREDAVHQLMAAFERVSQGSSELVIVRGYSGVGKTALVNELLRQLTRHKGYFAVGKFDQLQQNIPLAALMQAYRGLIQQLLMESSERLQYWHDRFLSYLGSNAQLMVTMIPDLELILGAQPPVPELGSLEATNRLIRTFNRFAQALQSAEHPRVLFMDDFQWADRASLQSLQTFMANRENHYSLTIIAYRDNEVTPPHPFLTTLEAMRETGATITDICLEPLGLAHIIQLVAEAFHTLAATVTPLAQLLFEKTAGNPFFLIQLLKSLHEDGLIWFDSRVALDRPALRNPPKGGRWNWDLARIQQQDITDNVVDLMIGKITKLAEPTQHLLQLAACLGNLFDLQTLATVSEQSLSQTAQNLWEAIETGFVVPIGTGYQFSQVLNHDERMVGIDQDYSIQYRFLHDRIQQAAYCLISTDRRPDTHFTIGQRLLCGTPAEQQHERIFEIVSHLNYGIDRVTAPPERHRLAELNIRAGQKAKTAMAYSEAGHYFNAGIQFLTPQDWDLATELTRQLYEEAAEAALFNHDFDRMEALIQTLLHHTSELVDQVRGYDIQLRAYQVQGRYLQAIDLGRQLLPQFGLHLPLSIQPSDLQAAVNQILLAVGDRSIEQLADLPLMTSSQGLGALRILISLTPSVYHAAPELYPLLACAQVNLSLQYGNALLSPPGYADFGLVLNILNQFEEGYQFGQLALKIVERLQAKAVQSMTTFKVAGFNQHNQQPLRQAIALLQTSYAIGLETGDFLYAMASARFQYFYRYLGATEELESLLNAIQTFQSDFTVPQSFLSWSAIISQAIQNLTDGSPHPANLTGDYCQEEQFLPTLLQANDGVALHLFFLNKLILGYLFGDQAAALDSMLQGEQYLHGAVSMPSVPVFYYYSSLAQLAATASADAPQREQLLLNVRDRQTKLNRYAQCAPMNFQHKYELVEAERQRIAGNRAAAIDHYDRAIAGARANGYTQDEALSNELAAKFYLEWGKPRLAASYLQDASEGYYRWGAQAKVIDLETRYPQLLTPGLLSHASHSIGLDSSVNLTDLQTPDPLASSVGQPIIWMDLATILKVSQTISQEIQLERLLMTLMQVVIENAGAHTGTLILNGEDGWSIAAHCPKSQCCWLEAMPLTDSPLVPHSVVHYVQRTQDVVVIDDGALSNAFEADFYWQHHPAKSVLCVPILNQGKCIGIMYLENQVTAGIFTDDRRKIVQLIVAQAAISLENARLYSTLEQKVADRTQQLQASEERYRLLSEVSPAGIFRNDADGTIIYANRRWSEITGLPFVEGAGTDWLQCVHPDWRDRWETDWQSMIQAGSHRCVETCLQLPDGSLKWVYCQAQPEKDNDGRISGYVGTLTDITDRKQIELEIIRSRDLREAIFNDSADALFLVDPDTLLTLDCNNCAVQLFEASSKTELINIAGHTLQRQQFTDAEMTQIVNEVNTYGVWSQELEYISLKGTDFWGNLAVKQIWVADRQLNLVRVTDISDRKQAEALIRHSEEQLQLTLEFTGIGTWSWYPSTGEYHWNGKMEQLLELPTGMDTMFQSWRDRIHPDDVDRVETSIQQALVTRNAFAEEYRYRLLDGRFVWRWVMGQGVYTVTGALERVLGVVQDITEQKLTEAALKQSEASLLAAQRIARVGNWKFDLATQAVTWSEELFHLYGQDASQWTPTYTAFQKQTPLEDWPPLQQVIEHAIEDGTPYAIEHRVVRPDGSIRYALSRGEAVFDMQGQVIQLFGTTQDITEAKQAELSLQQTNQLLAAISEAQTQFITDADPGLLFDRLLETLLQLTNSEYGFIGEILYHADGQAYVDDSYMKLRGKPYLKTKLISDRAWTQESRWLDDAQAVAEIEFQNLKAIFSQVIATGQPVIVNSPTTELQWVGRPNDHPPLQAFLGIPFYRGDQLVGMVGIANRPEGYSQSLITDLAPFLTTCANTIEAYRNDARRKQAEAALQQLNEDLEQRVHQRTAELAQSEERLRLALTAANQGLYDLNLQTGEAIVSPEYATMLGYDPADFSESSMQWMARLHPDDRDRVLSVYQAYVAGEISTYKVEFRQQMKNGDWKWILSLGKIVAWDEQGKPMRMLGTHTDTSDRKRLEQELRQMNAELEQRVEARTLDLQKAMQAAEAANRAKSAFLANMSHELRTPLNAILGFSQLLSRNASLDTDQQDQINIINRSGEHLLNLINDILELSKIEAGRVTLMTNDFDLWQLLHHLGKLFHLRAEAKRLTLSVHYSADVPQYIRADESKLRQVLINLISNAIKFTPEGAVTVRVQRVTESGEWVIPPSHRQVPDSQISDNYSSESCLSESCLSESCLSESCLLDNCLADNHSSDNHVSDNYVSDSHLSDQASQHPVLLHFSVQDTGSGVDPTEQAILFEPFIQAKMGRASQEGTGLGLSISQQFVRLMGGELGVTSVPGHGATFAFQIAVLSVPPPDLPPQPSNNKVIGLAPDQPSYRILVVEDHHENRQFLVQLLRSIGFEVREAENGQEAVSVWQQWIPHLIWMDMRMPVMDGYEATCHIRAIEALDTPSATTKILALTASTFETERTAILAAGCNDFVCKPATATILFGKMAEHIGVQYRYQEPSASSDHSPPPENLSHQQLLAGLQTLSPDWIKHLHQAARMADEEVIVQFLNQIPPHQTALAYGLQSLVNQLRFDKLINLTSAALNAPSLDRPDSDRPDSDLSDDDLQ